jgi:hypothetical protein
MLQVGKLVPIPEGDEDELEEWDQERAASEEREQAKQAPKAPKQVRNDALQKEDLSTKPSASAAVSANEQVLASESATQNTRNAGGGSGNHVKMSQNDQRGRGDSAEVDDKADTEAGGALGQGRLFLGRFTPSRLLKGFGKKSKVKEGKGGASSSLAYSSSPASTTEDPGTAADAEANLTRKRGTDAVEGRGVRSREDNGEDTDKRAVAQKLAQAQGLSSSSSSRSAETLQVDAAGVGALDALSDSGLSSMSSLGMQSNDRNVTEASSKATNVTEASSKATNGGSEATEATRQGKEQAGIWESYSTARTQDIACKIDMANKSGNDYVEIAVTTSITMVALCAYGCSYVLCVASVRRRCMRLHM